MEVKKKINKPKLFFLNATVFPAKSLKNEIQLEIRLFNNVIAVTIATPHHKTNIGHW